MVKLDSPYFKDFNKQELRVARNELFAWHGYDFRSEDMKAHFENQDWYQPTDITSLAIMQQLSAIETHNIKLIEAIEKERY
ncbi:MAG: YARHG domain-containing protein [Bacteroidota bacterium]